VQPSDDLVALFDVLRRVTSPTDKARTLARAWRTVRDLSPAERSWLAREVGFEGAEELVEGLADRGDRGLAPAAVLEALGRARDSRSFSVRGLFAELRDPSRREELLARGVDLVADALVGDREAAVSPSVGFDSGAELEVPVPDTGADTDDPEGSEAERELEEDGPPEVGAAESAEEPAVPPPPPEPPPEPPAFETQPPDVRRAPEPEPQLEISDPSEPSVWDEMWAPSESLSVSGAVAPGVADGQPVHDRPAVSAIRRLQQLRSEIEGLGARDASALRDLLDRFPEPWARRRAMVALIEAGIPRDAAGALDLIESLDRALDRRWCLSALARRGDLTGADLERAVAMLASPAARRRVERLAGA
jgi:hypothetical protein